MADQPLLPLVGWTTLDADHWYAFQHVLFSDDREILVGLTLRHLNQTSGDTCYVSVVLDLPGSALVAPPEQRWPVETLDPLTLGRSIQCELCGDHGHLKGGKWIAAE